MENTLVTISCLCDDFLCAYGFKDEKFKYLLSAAYSFNNKSIYTFPESYIKATVQYDTKIPGEELAFTQPDAFFLSFKRGVDDKYLYNNYYKIDWVKEFENHFSYAFVSEVLRLENVIQ